MKRYRVERDINAEVLEEVLNRWSTLNWALESLTNSSPTTYNIIFSLDKDDLAMYLADNDDTNENYFPEPPKGNTNGGEQKKKKKAKTKR